MSGNNVDISITGDDAEALRMWQRQLKQIDKQEAKLKKMGIAGKNAGMYLKKGFSESQGSLQNMNVSLTKTLALFGGLSTGVNLFKRNYAELLKYQQNREVEGRTFGEQMRQTRVNFSEDATLKNQDLEREIRAVGGRTKTDAKLVAAAVSDAFSAKGGLTNQDALNAVEAAFALQPNNLEAAQTTAARALDVANRSGNKNMKENVGFMQNIAGTARVTQLPLVGKNLLPAISAIQNFGDTPEQSAEMVVTLNKMLEDDTGATTGTAAKALAGRLKNFVPKKNAKDDLGKFTVPQEQIDAFNQAQNTTERVKVAQQNPELARAFFAENPFATEYDAIIKQYLSKNKGTQEIQQYVEKSILPLGKEQGKVFQQKLDEINAGQKQALVEAAEANKANVQELRLSDTMSGLQSASKNLVDSALEESPSNWMKRQAAWLTHEAFRGFDFYGNGENANPVLRDNEFLRGLRLRSAQTAGENDPYTKFLDEQVKTSDKLVQKYVAQKFAKAAGKGLDRATSGQPAEEITRPALQPQAAQRAAAPQQAPAQLGGIDLMQALTTLTEVIRSAALNNGSPIVPKRTPPRKLAVEKLSRGE